MLIEEEFILKMKLVLWPFIKIAICSIVIYTFIYWLFIFQIEWPDPENDKLIIYLSLIFLCIPIGIWLWPPNNMLRFNNNESAIGVSFFQFGLIALLVILSVSYIDKKAGKLTKLQNINYIDSHSSTKYYSLKHYFLHSKSAIVKTNTYTSGKRSSNFNMEFYAYVPLLKSELDTQNSKNYNYWAVFYFHQIISNSTSPDIKNNIFNTFYTDCLKDTKEVNSYDFTYMEQFKNITDMEYFKEAVGANKKRIHEKPYFYYLNYIPFAERGKENLTFLLVAVPIVLFIIIAILFLNDFNSQKLNDFKIK